MTITYSLDVANTRFCGFAKLLGRWKGSIYKILWKEFLVFIAGYTLLSLTYRYFLNEYQKGVFESLVIYFEDYIDLIPLSFVLGFYVSLVIGRWWSQFDAIPWPDRMCYMIATYVHGADERSRIIRRTLGRYLILMQALTFQGVSTAFKRRFPTTQHLVAAGIMTKEERTVYESVEAPYGKWWLPAQWFSALAMRARKEGRIKDSILLDGLFREFCLYRSTCGNMFNYDWISVPLVYTQVVTLATYTYSLALMVGRQYLDPSKGYDNHKVDLYVPIFTLLQLFFYIGWLKVAEQIVNPYGEDDDDFEINWCMDRSCHIVYLLVDHFHTKHPKLRKDAFWDEMLPQLPQTKISSKYIINPQLGSAFNLEVNPADAEFIPMETLLEEDNEANVYSSDSVKQPRSVHYRPSFIANLFNSVTGQTVRKRTMSKTESFREVQSQINPGYARSGSTPNQSRKSSLAKRTSPTHSRASSISQALGRHRQRSLEVDSQLGNGIATDCEGVLAAAIAPIVANCEEKKATEPDHMPSIPEEPSRVVSTVCTDSTSKDEVQALVAEASKVLEELNKVVHAKECALKGYESCCSLDDSSDEDSDEAHLTHSVVVDIPGTQGESPESLQEHL